MLLLFLSLLPLSAPFAVLPTKALTRRWSSPEEKAEEAGVEAAAPAVVEEAVVAPKDPFTVELSGLRWKDDRVGDGEIPEEGDIVFIDYRGSLTKTGKEFDNSYDRGAPLSFEIGKRKVIPGMDEGVKGMKIGGKRTLVIPPRLGYGPIDLGTIPPNSELQFVVELKDVKSGFGAKAAAVLDNVKGSFGLNPFTFFTGIFLFLFVAPFILPEDNPLRH